MPNENTYKTRVVGGRFRKDVDWSKIHAGQSVRIVHDPLGRATGNNHADANALAVFTQQQGVDRQIGYLPREEAAVIGPHVASGALAIKGRLTWVTGADNVHLQYELSEVPVETAHQAPTITVGPY